MAVGFMAGSIVSKMMLDTTKWSNSIKVVKADEGTLKGFAARNAEGFRKMGAAMTVAGVAIVTGLILAVNKAADAQETFAKFETVFQDVGTEAEAMATDLADSFGLSEVAAKDMLGATGDLLTGLGMGADVALDLSAKTQQLAVDLASFTNFSGGATGASEALTKAMLGERESIKALGIVITEEMVKEVLLAEGKENLTGLAKKQAMAEATLTIAIGQSKNAIGDYERTSGSLVNQKRLLAARTEDLVNTLGTHLIPIVTSIVTKVTEVVSKITDWMKANPKLTGTIVKIAAGTGALLAVLGPIVIILPKIIGSIVAFKKAMLLLNVTMGLATIGIGLVVVALAALVIGYMKVKKAQDKAREAAELYNEVSGNFEDKLRGIAKEAGLTAEQFEELKKKYKGNINVMALAIKRGDESLELQEAMNKKGKENIELQEEQKKAQENTLPSLTALAEGMDTVGTSAFKLGTKIGDYAIPAIMQLELDLISLKDEYDNHNLTLDEYIDNQIAIETRLKKLKGGFEEVELAIEDTDIEIFGMGVDLNAMVLSGIADLGDLSTTIGGLPKDFVEAARKTKTKIKTWWTETTDGMKTKWGNMWGSFLKGPISLKSFGDAFKAFGEGLKQQFADLIGSMIAKWTTGFLENLVTSTATSAGKVANSIAGVGKSAMKLATNFSPGGIIASAVGSAVGTFLGSILGPKGAGERDTQLIKDNTWATNQNVLNAVFNLDSIKWSLWNFAPILEDMKLTLWDQTTILGMINDKLGAAPKTASGIPPAASAASPGGITIGTIKQSVTINGTMISDRDWARKSLIPEIFHALKQRALKRELQSILGIA